MSMKSANAINPKAAVLTIVLFTSCNSIFFKLSTVPATVFVSLRFLLCALVFFSVLAIRAIKNGQKLFTLKPKRFVALFLIGFIFSFGAYVYFIALKKTALSSVLILTSSNSIFVVLLSLLFLRDHFSSKSIMAILTAFMGCIIIVVTKNNGLENSIEGNLLALTCAVCSAVYTVFMKRFSDVNVPEKLFSVYSGSFVFAAAAALLQGNSFIAFESGEMFPACEYLWILCSAVLSVCIPQGVINWALKWVKAAFVGSVTLLEPIIGYIYGYLIWSEGITLNHIVGGIFVIGGLYLYNRSESKTSGSTGGTGSSDGNGREKRTG